MNATEEVFLHHIRSLVLALLAGRALMGCADAEKAAYAQDPARSTAGWYMEHAGQGSFQPCGQQKPLRIAAAADLQARAKAFGLTEDTPVYVRVTGSTSGGEIRVSSVEQFGSPTPVRDCGLTGVVIPTP